MNRLQILLLLDDFRILFAGHIVMPHLGILDTSLCIVCFKLKAAAEYVRKFCTVAHSTACHTNFAVIEIGACHQRSHD